MLGNSQENRYINNLILRNNDIFAIPVGGFKNAIVEYLDLGNNKITYVLADAFTHVAKLSNLQLHYNEIAAIHPSAFGTQSLNMLNLSNNKLKCLPEVIFAQLDRVELSLIENQLTSIPSNMHFELTAVLFAG